MKHALAFTLLILSLPVVTFAQFGSIKGEGDVVKQEIQLGTLKGVRLGFSGDIILTQGSSQKIVREGQQNILDNIKRDVSDGIWKVNYDKNVNNAKSVRIYITLATLTEVAVSGSGDVSTTNTFERLGDLEIRLSGSGNISLDVNATEVETSISGSGNISLDGSAKSLDVHISGSGKIDAVDLRTEACEVSISGSGDARINCTSSIETSISGSGNVHYKGNAPKVKASVSGSGDVHEIQ
jgi:hypothetical protein